MDREREMRNCPVCEYPERNLIFSMTYNIPDGWTVPGKIDWYTCSKCTMLYGDGDFTQADLNTYYRERYGYGINNPSNVARLTEDANKLSWMVDDGLIVDFGGAGDDGSSIIVNELKLLGKRGVCVNAGDMIPECEIIYASHVIEHVYDLPETMTLLTSALVEGGTLIIDVPDSTGLLQYWQMPILDFNTKHINHFTLRTLLELGRRHGFELVKLVQYRLENAPAWQVHFKRMDIASASAKHIQKNIEHRIDELRKIKQPVNVWGLGDVTWHLLSLVDLNVLDYIDNDPAMRGHTFKGKLILEKPTNDAPIVIFAQGQRGRLIENIRRSGIINEIIEI